MVLQRPQPGSWTYEDLLALPDDGTRYEIIEGDLFEMTGPDGAHALAIRNLIALLLPWFAATGMEWFTAPLDIFFGAANPVQPDLVAFTRNGQWRLSRRGIDGVPALAIEVLSPSTRGKDLLVKKPLYERSGVSECWIVDPADRTVQVLSLQGDAYQEICRAEGDGPVRSRLFPDLDVPASAVFAE